MRPNIAVSGDGVKHRRIQAMPDPETLLAILFHAATPL